MPPSATPPPTGTPTATSVPPTVAATATLGPTATSSLPSETATIDGSSTLTATVPSTPGPVITSNTLPEDVYGLAVVSLTDGATSARLRDLPNGDQIITAVPHDTKVTVLFGRVELEGTLWVQGRLEAGTEGWMAECLLRITSAGHNPPG